MRPRPPPDSREAQHKTKEASRELAHKGEPPLFYVGGEAAVSPGEGGVIGKPLSPEGGEASGGAHKGGPPLFYVTHILQYTSLLGNIYTYHAGKKPWHSTPSNHKKKGNTMRKYLTILLVLLLFAAAWAQKPARAAEWPYSWGHEITADITDGRYLTENLGMEHVTRQRMLQVIKSNWTEGLCYHDAIYSGAWRNPPKAVNYGTMQYSGRAREGYGYNCTGFVASVLYYANGGSPENALAEMNELYKDVAVTRVPGKQYGYADGTAWYYYFNGMKDGKTGALPRTNLYLLEKAENTDAMQKLLDQADEEGKLKEGYILYFWPLENTDCHLAVYAGRDRNGLHQMYHAIGGAGKTKHGVYIESDITLSQVTGFPSDILIVPLPEGDDKAFDAMVQTKNEEDLIGWQKSNRKWYYYKTPGELQKGWKKLAGKWYYFDESGAMQTGWRMIDDKWYFFKSGGAMAAGEYCSGYWLNRNGTWTYKARASWNRDSKGWKYTDTRGWQASNEVYTIDGTEYRFTADGYLQ